MSRIVANIQRAPVSINAPNAYFRPWLKYLVVAFSGCLGVFLVFAVTLWAVGSYRVLSDDPTVWQSNIDQLVIQNQNDANLHDLPSTLFVGSSSIRLFKGLETLFINNHVIRNGFGGAKINDLTHYKEPLIFQHNPNVVVFYIGINDILYRDHQHVKQLSDDFFVLADDVRARMETTQLVLVALRPLLKPEYAKKINEYNTHLALYADKYANVHFINPNQALLDSQGRINQSLLHWDGLHLNDKGYRIWGTAIRDILSTSRLLP